MPNLHAEFKTKTLLNKITVTDEENALIEQIITDAKAHDVKTSLGFMNQHGFNLIAKNSVLLKPFEDLDYILRDGIGMKLAFKFFKMPAGANLNGTDFIPLLVNKVANSNLNHNTDFFVLGTQSPWLEKGTAQLLSGQTFQTLDGFKELPEYIEFLTQNMNPNVFNMIILAMGMPKLEELAALIKQTIKRPGLVVCGGAIIDFQAGRFPRAPQIFRTLSIEWLYRLLKEPRRLFKRYVIGIPVFFNNLYKFKDITSNANPKSK
jgi:beta-1,4-glucosyltransferase